MKEKNKRVIALGFFDGVHLGHQALLGQAMERGEALGLRPAVFTFDRSTREFVTGLPGRQRSGSRWWKLCFRGWRRS